MQINSINSNEPAFGAKFRVKPKDMDYVMSQLDSNCSIADLRRIYVALRGGEKGKGSKDIVYIQKANPDQIKGQILDFGSFDAKINGKNYSSYGSLNLSSCSIPHYFEKLQRISKQKYTSLSKNIQNKFNELGAELNDMTNRVLFLRKPNDKKLIRRRDGFLDAIYTILSGKGEKKCK
jgi:hypothetical protein